MALGIEARAAWPRKRVLLWTRRPRERDIRKWCRAIRDYLSGYAQSDVQTIETERGTLVEASLHPAEWPMELTATPTSVSASVRTSWGGPGYHELVCEILDGLADRCGLAWEVRDGTGYWDDRNRKQLEDSHCSFLHSIAQSAFERGNPSGFTLGLPFWGHPLTRGPDILTAMGPRPLEWLREAAESEGDPSILKNYFPMWSRARDARFWLNYAEALRWTHIIWQPVPSPRQALRRANMLKAYREALKLDPAAKIPDLEIRRISKMMGEKQERQAPPAQGRFVGGYRLSPFEWTIGGNWTLRVPGHWQEPALQDDEHWAIVGDNMTVHLTLYFRDPQTTPEGESEIARTLRRDLQAKMIRPLRETAEEGLRSLAGVLRDREESGYVLQGWKESPERACLCTIWFAEPSREDDAWKIWESLVPAAPGIEPVV